MRPSCTIHFGDRVALFCEKSGGHIYSPGVADPKLFVSPTAEKPTHFERCVFTVEKVRTWASVQDVSIVQGKEAVLFGNLAQLRHEASGCILTVARHRKEEGRALYVVQLTRPTAEWSEEQSSATVFRLMPRYKIRQEGEKIMTGDHIVFENSLYKVFLFTAPPSPAGEQQQMMSKTSSEIIGGPFPDSYSFTMYDSARGGEHIHSGTFVLLFHKEQEAFVHSTGINKVRLMHPHIRDSTYNIAKLDFSSNSLWILEMPDPAHASSVKGPPEMYRIKHCATGKYLGLTEDGPELSDLFFMDSTMEDPTLWSLVPCDPTTKVISDSSTFFRLLNISTNQWLHAQALDDENGQDMQNAREVTENTLMNLGSSFFGSLSNLVEESFDLPAQPNQPAAFRDAHWEFLSSSKSLVSDQSLAKDRGQLTTREKAAYVDVFSIVTVSLEIARALHLVLGNGSVIKQFCEAARQAKTLVELEESEITTRCIESVEDLLPFCASAVEIHSDHQKMLIDQWLHISLIELLFAPFAQDIVKANHLLTNKATLKGIIEFDGLRDKLAMHPQIRMLWCTTFKLLRVIVKGNSKGCEHIAPYLPRLLEFVPALPAACGVFIEITRLKGLTHAIAKELIHTAVPMLSQGEEYYLLVEELCFMQGKPVMENQQLIYQEVQAANIVPQLYRTGQIISLKFPYFGHSVVPITAFERDAHATRVASGLWRILAACTAGTGTFPRDAWLPESTFCSVFGYNMLQPIQCSFVRVAHSIFCSQTTMFAAESVWIWEEKPAAPLRPTAAQTVIVKESLKLLRRCTDKYETILTTMPLLNELLILWGSIVRTRLYEESCESELAPTINNIFTLIPSPRCDAQVMHSGDIAECVYHTITLLRLLLERYASDMAKALQNTFRSSYETVNVEELKASLHVPEAAVFNKDWAPILFELSTFPHTRLANIALSTAFDLLAPLRMVVSILPVAIVFNADVSPSSVGTVVSALRKIQTLSLSDKLNIEIDTLLMARQLIPTAVDLQNLIMMTKTHNTLVGFIEQYLKGPSDRSMATVLRALELLLFVITNNNAATREVLMFLPTLIQLSSVPKILRCDHYLGLLEGLFSHEDSKDLVIDTATTVNELLNNISALPRRGVRLLIAMATSEECSLPTQRAVLNAIAEADVSQLEASVVADFLELLTLCATSPAAREAVVQFFPIAHVGEILSFEHDIEAQRKISAFLTKTHFAHIAEGIPYVLEPVAGRAIAHYLLAPIESRTVDDCTKFNVIDLELVRALISLGRANKMLFSSEIARIATNVVGCTLPVSGKLREDLRTVITDILQAVNSYLHPAVIRGLSHKLETISHLENLEQKEAPPEPTACVSVLWTELLSKIQDEFQEPTAEQLLPLTGIMAGKGNSGKKLVNIVINQLRAGALDEWVTVDLLLCFQCILEMAKEESESSLVEMQDFLNTMHATPLISILLERSAFSIVRHAVHFGILLLEGGNKKCQDALLHYFHNNDEKFFYTIRQHLKTAQQEICLRFATYPKQDSVPSASKTVSALAEALCRLLQLLCEGHHFDFQNYVRLQHDNFNSYNMCFLVMELLHTVVKRLDNSTISIAIQAVNTLTEVCQGPCQLNQAAIVGCNVVTEVNHVLTSEYERVDDTDAVMQLKSGAIITLLSLLEGAQEAVIPNLILTTLNYSALQSLLEHVWMEQHGDESLLDLAFNIFILANTLIAEGDKAKGEALRAVLKQTNGYDYFNSMICTIEIWRDDDPKLLRLETVYFRKPEISTLRDDTKEAVLNSVDRSSLVSKHSDFFRKADDLIFTMEYQYLIETTARDLPWWMNIFGLATCHPRPFENWLLILSSMANAMLIGGSQTREGAASWAAAIWFFLLGVLQAALCVYLVAVRFILKLPLVAHQGCKRGEEDPFFSLSLQDKVAHVATLHNLITVLREIYTLFFGFCGFMSVCGILISPYFYSFLLLGIMYKAPLLGNIVRAITMNGKQLLLTGFLGAIVVYFFTVVGFLFFHEHFEADEASNCETLVQCFFFTFGKGVRGGGGIGEELKTNRWTSDDFFFREAYDTLFFIVVAVIVMNIIFALIVDTFAELRDAKKKIEEDMRTTCFVCGIDAATFDREGEGFVPHTKGSHNMWQYLYFMHHLRRKEVCEFTGQESYVYSKMSRHDLSFFPVNRSKSLQKREAIDEEEEQRNNNGGIGTIELRRVIDEALNAHDKELQQQQQPDEDSLASKRASALWDTAKKRFNPRRSPSRGPNSEPPTSLLSVLDEIEQLRGSIAKMRKQIDEL